MPANVLILGCGRSGTSIFWELFEALPGYRCVSEPSLEELRAASGDGPLAVKVPRPHPDHPAPAGSPLPVDLMTALVGEPRVLFWQVRHPLDAVASLRVGIARDWGHHPRPPDFHDWLDRPLVERCAHHWATVNGPGYDAVAGEAVVNRFEDMLRDPAACARATAAAVGASADGPGVAAWARRVRDADDEHFVEARTSRRHSRPDHSRRVGRWRENLGPDDVRAAVPIVAVPAARFGYRLPDVGAPR